MGDFFKKTTKNILNFSGYLSNKKAATLTGALAYFLFAGFLPFLSALGMAAKLFGMGEDLFLKTFGFAFGVAATLAESDISAAGSVGKITAATVFFALISLYSSSKFCVRLGEAGKLMNMRKEYEQCPEKIGKIKSKTDKNQEKTKNKKVGSGAFFKIAKRLLAAGVTLSSIGIFLAAMVIELFGSVVAELFFVPQSLVKTLCRVAGLFLNAALCVVLVRYATVNGGEKKYIKGSVLCFFVWLCAGMLFSLREKFFGRGAGLATAALFAFYLYVMMFGVVAGAGLNFYAAENVRSNRNYVCADGNRSEK